jgi:hypothetical protein
LPRPLSLGVRQKRGSRVSKPHLHELRASLERNGWQVVAVCPGNDYDISATWEIQRSASESRLMIDFEGLDDMACLPIEASYGCHIRGFEKASLYFRRIQRSRQLWEDELANFILYLDTVARA